MPVNPAEVKLFKLLEAKAAAVPQKPLEQQSIAEFRAGADMFFEFAGKPADVKFENHSVPARDGYAIPMRIYNADLGRSPVLMMYPGCGYVFDLFETNAIACSRIAKEAGIKVILVNFRLAPEYPLPTAIYDGYDATQYIVTQAAQFQIEANKLFIGGISSGAHCAAVITNLARQDKQLTIQRQILINGYFDLTQSNHDYDEYEKEDKIFVRTAIMDFIFKQWGIKAENFKSPLFSPYYEPDLTHLPPTTIIVGEYDGLRNDSESYYQKLKAAGNAVTKIVLPGQTHNTMVMRSVLSDGEDPAHVIANSIKAEL